MWGPGQNRCVGSGSSPRWHTAYPQRRCAQASAAFSRRERAASLGSTARFARHPEHHALRPRNTQWTLRAGSAQLYAQKKSRLKSPKYRKFVTSLQTCAGRGSTSARAQGVHVSGRCVGEVSARTRARARVYVGLRAGGVPVARGGSRRTKNGLPSLRPGQGATCCLLTMRSPLKYRCSGDTISSCYAEGIRAGAQVVRAELAKAGKSSPRFGIGATRDTRHATRDTLPRERRRAGWGVRDTSSRGTGAIHPGQEARRGVSATYTCQCREEARGGVGPRDHWHLLAAHDATRGEGEGGVAILSSVPPSLPPSLPEFAGGPRGQHNVAASKTGEPRRGAGYVREALFH